MNSDKFVWITLTIMSAVLQPRWLTVCFIRQANKYLQDLDSLDDNLHLIVLIGFVVPHTVEVLHNPGPEGMDERGAYLTVLALEDRAHRL